MFLMRRYCFLGAFFEVSSLNALTFHHSWRPFLTNLALSLLLILFVFLSPPSAFLELGNLLNILNEFFLLEVIKPILLLFDLGSQMGQLVMRLACIHFQPHLKACRLAVLASFGQKLLKLIETVLVERFLEVILNYGYFELAGQPILQIVEGGPIEP